MTDGNDPEGMADPESVVQLRGEGPRVVRLSRKAVGIVSAAGLTLIGGALLYALRPEPLPGQAELLNTDHVAVAEGLSSAPRDYAGVPRLGPPLPGDLGRPILAAQDRGSVAALPPLGPQPVTDIQSGIDPVAAARQRREHEHEAARSSRLFFGGGASSPGIAQVDTDPSTPPTDTAPASAPVAAAPSDPRIERAAISPQRLAAAASSATLLQAGSIIPAALITGVRSDRPGLVTAQVTQNVYDSLTGRNLLIPQGARLIGDYEADVGFGQRRVLLTWNRLILPDGRSIALDRQPATDTSGFAGLEDRVDDHWAGVLKAALVSTLLGIGGELGAGNDSDLARAVRRGSQDSIGQAGEQVVSRELAIRPTLTIRPGYPVRVLVTRDLVLENGS